MFITFIYTGLQGLFSIYALLLGLYSYKVYPIPTSLFFWYKNCLPSYDMLYAFTSAFTSGWQGLGKRISRSKFSCKSKAFVGCHIRQPLSPLQAHSMAALFTISRKAELRWLFSSPLSCKRSSIVFCSCLPSGILYNIFCLPTAMYKKGCTVFSSGGTASWLPMRILRAFTCSSRALSQYGSRICTCRPYLRSNPSAPVLQTSTILLSSPCIFSGEFQSCWIMSRSLHTIFPVLCVYRVILEDRTIVWVGPSSAKFFTIRSFPSLCRRMVLCPSSNTFTGCRHWYPSISTKRATTCRPNSTNCVYMCTGPGDVLLFFTMQTILGLQFSVQASLGSCCTASVIFSSSFTVTISDAKMLFIRERTYYEEPVSCSDPGRQRAAAFIFSYIPVLACFSAFSTSRASRYCLYCSGVISTFSILRGSSVGNTLLCSFWFPAYLIIPTTRFTTLSAFTGLFVVLLSYAVYNLSYCRGITIRPLTILQQGTISKGSFEHGVPVTNRIRIFLPCILLLYSWRAFVLSLALLLFPLQRLCASSTMCRHPFTDPPAFMFCCPMLYASTDTNLQRREIFCTSLECSVVSGYTSLLCFTKDCWKFVCNDLGAIRIGLYICASAMASDRLKMVFPMPIWCYMWRPRVFSPWPIPNLRSEKAVYITNWYYFRARAKRAVCVVSLLSCSSLYFSNTSFE
uniref:PQ706L n=1 Tax=African swine fever virus TaxID=10497 RepID=A0A6G7KTH6_ASF